MKRCAIVNGAKKSRNGWCGIATRSEQSPARCCRFTAPITAPFTNVPLTIPLFYHLIACLEDIKVVFDFCLQNLLIHNVDFRLSLRIAYSRCSDLCHNKSSFHEVPQVRVTDLKMCSFCPWMVNQDVLWVYELAGMAQWWDRTSPTALTGVRFPNLALHASVWRFNSRSPFRASSFPRSTGNSEQEEPPRGMFTTKFPFDLDVSSTFVSPFLQSSWFWTFRVRLGL